MKFYKKFILCASAAFCCNTFLAQEGGSIVCVYDKSGNLIERKIQVMPRAQIQPKKDTLQRNFKVYPNPTNQFVNIEGPLPEKFRSGEVVLLSISGQVLKKEIYTGEPKTLIVSDLKPGVYLLEIWYSKKQKSTYKIIVTN